MRKTIFLAAATLMLAGAASAQQQPTPQPSPATPKAQPAVPAIQSVSIVDIKDWERDAFEKVIRHHPKALIRF